MEPPLRSRYLTAMAFVEEREGRSSSALDLLLEAAGLDSSFYLPQLSLGRHFLFAERDEMAARPYFERAISAAPKSFTSLFGLVSLEAETGRYPEAFSASKAVLRRYPWRLLPWLSLLSSAILASPRKGRILTTILAITAFIPWVGPFTLIIWPFVAISTFLGMKKTSPRLSLTPVFAYVPFLFSYFVRWTLYGTWLP